MRNVWKGLVVGAVTGAAVGLALDVLFGAREQVVGATRVARRRLREADLPDQVRSTASGVAATGQRAVRTVLESARDGRR